LDEKDEEKNRMRDPEGTVGHMMDKTSGSIISSIDRAGFPNPKACVYFFDMGFYRGVMLKGAMSVLHDKRSKKWTWILHGTAGEQTAAFRSNVSEDH
jgi:hypothetical protein